MPQSLGMICRHHPHPSHHGFAKAIGADIISIGKNKANSLAAITQELYQGIQLDDYDILIAEGSRPLYATLTNSIIKDIKLIYLCADHRFYELWSGKVVINSPYTFLKSTATTYGKPIIKRVCQREIDGVIAVSELASEFVRPVIKEKTPIEITHPYIQPEKYTTLSEVDPLLSENNAVTVGQASHYKGVDLLASAWSEIRQTQPDATLHIVGKGHPPSYEDTDGVVVHGFVENLTEVFAKASLYVQPSRMDTFPVSVLEALRAGLPAIVTKTTGSRSEIEKINRDMITKPTPQGLKNAITAYFDKDDEDRSQLSKLARNRSEQFNHRDKKTEFKAAFEQVTEAKN